MDFLTQAGYLQGSMSQMKCQLKKKEWTWWWKRAAEESQKPQVEYLPGPGFHTFSFRGKKMWATSTESEPMVTGWERKPTKYEILTIYTYGQST